MKPRSRVRSNAVRGLLNQATKLTGQTARTIRLKLDLSQEAFGALVGQSYATINRWENERSKPQGMSALVYELLDRGLRRGASPVEIITTLRAETERVEMIKSLMLLAG